MNIKIYREVGYYFYSLFYEKYLLHQEEDGKRILQSVQECMLCV